MSLESSETWAMLIDPGLESAPPALSIGSLQTFVGGFQAALESSGRARDDGFFLWLRDEAGAFPPEGWARFLLASEGGNHEAAIRKLFGHLHRYLLETRPGWFVRLNQEPQPSLIVNGLGEPLVPDVRLAAHVIATAGAPPVASLDLRFSAFEMSDGYVMRLGLPADVGTWWSGSGRRLAVMGSRERLEAVRGGTTPLSALLQPLGGEACVLDATTDGVDVVSSGACGAIHIREGQLIAHTVVDEVAHWRLQPGDRVLLLSAPLFGRATELGHGRLPPQLATGEPVAWAQFVDDSGRRLAVSVSRPG